MVDEDLEPLITRCPNCATQFRVTENQLAAAGGRVRCGACLTVFQGIDHLILDEESTFASGSEADAALDALLDELGSEEPASGVEEVPGSEEMPQASEAEPLVKAQPLLNAQPIETFEPPRQLYGGFEDDLPEESNLEERAGTGTDQQETPAVDAADVESGAVAAGSFQIDQTEAVEDSEVFDESVIIEQDVAESVVAERFEEVPDAETAAVEDDGGRPVGDDPREPVEDGGPEPAEDGDREPVEDGDREPAGDNAWPEEDYEKWIAPGTANIDQLVDEVVASGRPAADEADGIDHSAASGADLEDGAIPATVVSDGGFHLSAVENALAEEGVGVRPISFAPEPRRWWVGGVAALLIVLLAGQVFYLQLPEWSRDPGLRGTYERFCGLFGCELAEMRSVGALRTRNLVVRSHPELQGALIIDAVIVNQAGFPQRFPDLELKFTSVGGLLVAARVFTPAEYLAGEMGRGDLMPSSTPVQISLEINDPGNEAVNYTLSFH